MHKLKFSVHPLYIALGIALTAIGEGYTFVVYSMVLILHEMGHSFMAERRGYVLDEVYLMPYGAVLKGSLEGLKERDEIYIALFGPLTNLIFAVLFIAAWWLIPVTYFFTEVFAIASVVTAIFNLLPVYPLDGGRVLLAFLKTRMPTLKAMKTARITGIVVASLFLALCITAVILSFNITFAIIGGFVFFSSLFRIKTGEYTRLYCTSARTHEIARGIEKREYVLSWDSKVIDCLRLCNNQYVVNIILVDKDKKEKIRLDEKKLDEIFLKYSPDTKLNSIKEVHDLNT